MEGKYIEIYVKNNQTLTLKPIKTRKNRKKLKNRKLTLTKNHSRTRKKPNPKKRGGSFNFFF